VILEGATRTSVVRWKVMDVGDRTLYVEARVRTFTDDSGSVGGLTVSPFAIVVKEREREYVISLGGNEPASFGRQLFEMLL
jgi:hypothetical protein